MRHRLGHGDLVTLKVIPLDADTAFGYCGRTDVGMAVMRELSASPDPLATRIEYLRHAQAAADATTEFLLASWSERCAITFKHGEIERGPVGWIGDGSAFAEYQPRRVAALDAKTDLVERVGATNSDPSFSRHLLDRVHCSAMRAAMREVIDDPTVKYAGGFVVALAHDGNGFRYLDEGRTELGHSITFHPDGTVDEGEDIGGGAYCYEVLGSDAYNVARLGIYFPIQAHGVTYAPLEDDEPRTHAGVTREQLKEFMAPLAK